MKVAGGQIECVRGAHPCFSRAALVVAHPGHELRLYGWMEAVRPRLFVLTDGSGRSGIGRVPSTSRIVELTGSERGEIYGQYTDAELYAAILQHRFDFFEHLRSSLCNALIANGIDLVVGDSIEGYNTIHDVWRLVINAAVKHANSKSNGRQVANYDFPVVGRPADCGTDDGTDVMLKLSGPVLERKIAAARGYLELADEVEASFNELGNEAFAIECLRSVTDVLQESATDKPFYEIHGERQVAAGHYKEAIRYREHILPIADALSDSKPRTG